jgi:hypothetical protein
MSLRGRIGGAADRVDLTPRSALALSGFGGPSGPSDGVADALEAIAVALRDASGRTAVIVTFDTLYVGPAVDTELRAFLRDECAIRDSDVLLLASHSHYAPALDPTKPRLGPVDADYLAWVIDQTKAMLRRLLASPMASLTLSPASAPWNGAVNRRRRWLLPYLGGASDTLGFHGPAMAPSAGPTDPSVRTWLLRTENGAPLALLWSAACHPNGFPRARHVSAEFPGRVREAVRDRLGPALSVLFLQGFAGDIRQRSPETRPALRSIARTLLWGPSFCPFDEAGWSRWADALSATVTGTLATENPIPLSGPIRSASTALDLSRLLDGDNGERLVEFRRLAIGDSLDLWAVAAEPSMALRDLLPKTEATVALGYLGDVFGYWPTARQAAEGGYEGGAFVARFGLSGRLRPSIDEAFRAMVKQLAIDDD